MPRPASALNAHRDRRQHAAPKIFSRERWRVRNSTQRRSADVMRVFATSDFLFWQSANARASSFVRIFASSATPTRPDLPREKNLRRMPPRGALTGPSRRKTRESVSTDSLKRHVRRPRAAPRGVAAREILACDSTCKASARHLRARVQRCRRTVALRCRAASSGDR